MMMSSNTTTTTTTTTSSRLRIGQLGRKVSTKAIRRGLQQARLDPNIRHIVFVDVDFADVVPDVQALCSSRRHLPSVKFVGGCTRMADVLTAVCESSVTRTLVISCPVVETAALRALDTGLRTNQSIRTLKLWGIDFMESSSSATAEDGAPLPSSSSSSCTNNVIHSRHHEDNSTSLPLLSGLSRNTTLHHLDLQRCHFDSSQHLGTSLRGCRSLRSLNLNDCHLSDETVAGIIKSFVPSSSSSSSSSSPSSCSLLSLNVSHNAIHVQTLQALTELLASPRCALESLNLSHGVSMNVTPGESSSTKCFTAALSHTFEALRCNTSLRELDVSGNTAVWQNTHVVQALMMSVSHHKTLRALHVADAGLTADGMTVIAHALPLLSAHVYTLDVLSGSNHTDDTVYDSLLQGLQHNTTLTSLGDKDDYDDDDGAKTTTDNDSVSTKLQQRLGHILTMNRAGRRAFVATDMLPLGIWSAVLARATTLEETPYDGLFGLLRQGPILWER